MKGILSAEQEKVLAVMLDDAIHLKGVWEIVDGYFMKGIITIVDDEYIDKLNPELKLQLQALATACIAEDVDLAGILVAGILNTLVDIPMLDESSEGLLFKGAINLIIGAVQKWIEDKE